MQKIAYLISFRSKKKKKRYLITKIINMKYNDPDNSDRNAELDIAGKRNRLQVTRRIL